MKWVQILLPASCSVFVIENLYQFLWIVIADSCLQVVILLFILRTPLVNSLNCVGELSFFGIVPYKDIRFRHISNGADSFIYASNVICIYIYIVYTTYILRLKCCCCCCYFGKNHHHHHQNHLNLLWFDLPKGILPDVALCSHRSMSVQKSVFRILSSK